MNVYDFDNTIYNGDSTADFYLFSLKRHKKIVLLFPSLILSTIKFYIFKIGTKTDFKEKMYRFLKYCDIQKDVNDFWNKNQNKIKKFYINQKNDDDVIISASPKFLLEPMCKKLGIKYLIASEVSTENYKYSGINCHGKEKVRRFYEVFPNSQIHNFYSDSYSDAPLANLADKAFMVKKNNIFDWKLKRQSL